MASLVGANRGFILNRIPHISGLAVHCTNAVLDHTKTAAVGEDPDFRGVLEGLSNGQVLTDFVRITDDGSKNGDYDRVSW